MPFRPIVLHGRPLAGGSLPAVCAPLVAATPAQLQAEAAAVAALAPDLLEWRIDFLAQAADGDTVQAAARAIREQSAGIPVLLTRRSQREGGQPLALTEAQVLGVYERLGACGLVDAFDYEMQSAPDDVARARAIATRQGAALVLSFHDFRRTPGPDELQERFAQAHRLGADVAKVAVMPQSAEDVLALLQATLAASRALPIPVVAMAMGGLGVASRICGGVFGSALTFAVGSAPSAPGQMPIADVRSALDILARAGNQRPASGGATSG